MKIVNYAEFAAMPEGTIFEYEFGPAHHEPGLLRKGTTWAADGDETDAGITIVNLSYAIERNDDTTGFLPEWEGEDREFRVYEAADLDRLAELIGRGKGHP